MAIDFTLTSYQRRLQRIAANSPTRFSLPWCARRMRTGSQKAFQAVKAPMSKATMGFVNGFDPQEVRWRRDSNVDLQIVVEELGAVDPASPPSSSSTDWP